MSERHIWRLNPLNRRQIEILVSDNAAHVDSSLNAHVAAFSPRATPAVEQTFVTVESILRKTRAQPPQWWSGRRTTHVQFNGLRSPVTDLGSFQKAGVSPTGDPIGFIKNTTCGYLNLKVGLFDTLSEAIERRWGRHWSNFNRFAMFVTHVCYSSCSCSVILIPTARPNPKRGVVKHANLRCNQKVFILGETLISSELPENDEKLGLFIYHTRAENRMTNTICTTSEPAQWNFCPHLATKLLYATAL